MIPQPPESLSASLEKQWKQRQTPTYKQTKRKLVGGVFVAVFALCSLAYFALPHLSTSTSTSTSSMQAQAQGQDDIASSDLVGSRMLLGFPARDGEKTFGRKALHSGAVILHILGMFYMFLAIAIVCDEFFVPAIDVIVLKLKMSPDAAGATFMAAGGSAPELFTSFIGVWITKDDVGIGTIVGSAVFNVLFVIGCCAIFSLTPLKLTWWPFFRDSVFYCTSLLILACFFQLSSAKKIVWWEALFLLCMYFVYVTIMFNNPAIYKFLSETVLKKPLTTTTADGQTVEDTTQMVTTRPLQFTISLFDLMTNDADISDLAGIHIVSRMKGDARTTFNSIDLDDNGTIDRNEFKSCLKRLGRHVTDDEVTACFDMIDTDKSGTIDFAEFSHWYVTSQWKIKQDVEHIFKRFDRNDDDQIDTDEIFDLLKAVNPDVTPAIDEVEEAKKVLDRNGDGRVTLQEFLDWWDSSSFFKSERKRRETVAQAEEAKAEEAGLSLAVPESTVGRILYFISLPIVLPLYYTVPDVRRDGWTEWWPVSLFMSMVCLLFCFFLYIIFFFLCMRLNFYLLIYLFMFFFE